MSAVEEIGASSDHSYSVLSASISPNSSQSELTKRLDEIICQFLVEQNIPGATLAITQHGRIVYEQGYGVAGAGRRMKADTVLRVASISKPITAIAVLRLCQDGKLSLDDKVFGAKGILKHLKTRGDKRLSLVTVRHLLQHSAGWDRDQAGDAVFFKVPVPAGMEITSSRYNSHLLQYVLNRKLQFTPGTRHAYSNLGYLALGEVIEAVTGQTYESYITPLLSHIGITDMYVGREERACWQSVEGEYFNIKEPMTVASLMPGQEDSFVLPQYGSFLMRNTGAFGGWVASACDLLTILHCLELDCGVQSCQDLVSGTTIQQARSHGLLDPSSVRVMLECPSYESGRDWYGLGLDVQDGGQTWGHTGAMEGTCATMQRHHSGLSWAFILNAWASDMDLDGVVKFAITSVQHLSPFPHTVAETCGKVLHVTTKDSCQCVVVHLPLHRFSLEIDKNSRNGFEPVWIGVNSAGQKQKTEPSFNIIFSRIKGLSARKTVLGIEVSRLSTVLQEYSKDGFQPELITTYENNGMFYGMALLLQRPCCCVQEVDVCVPAQQYVVLLNKRRKCGFQVVSQCVSYCRLSEQLVVTAIMERKSQSASRNLYLKAENCDFDCVSNGATKMKKNGETDHGGHVGLQTEYLHSVTNEQFKTDTEVTNEQFKTDDTEVTNEQFKTDDTEVTNEQFKTDDTEVTNEQFKTDDTEVTNEQFKTDDTEVTNEQFKTDDTEVTNEQFKTDTEVTNEQFKTDDTEVTNEQFKTDDTEVTNEQFKTDDTEVTNEQFKTDDTEVTNEQFKTDDIEYSEHLTTLDHKHLKTEHPSAEDGGFFEPSDSADLKIDSYDNLKSETSGLMNTEDCGCFQSMGQGEDKNAINRKRKLLCSSTELSSSSVEGKLSTPHFSVPSQALVCYDQPSLKLCECPSQHFDSHSQNSATVRTQRISSPRKVGRKRMFGRKQTSTTRLSWLQMPVESFITEMGRQAKHHRGLQNVHFYHEDTNWFVSGVWSSHCTHNCYHRLGVSQLGLLPALAEAAARDVYLRFVCQYEEDGVTYYALFWQAPQFCESV